MFWNRSLTRILADARLEHRRRLRLGADESRSRRPHPGTRGSLSPGRCSSRSTRRTRSSTTRRSSDVWSRARSGSPTGPARMTALVAGRYLDGWLGLRTQDHDLAERQPTRAGACCAWCCGCPPTRPARPSTSSAGASAARSPSPTARRRRSTSRSRTAGPGRSPSSRGRHC